MKQNQTVSDNLTGTFRKRYNDNDLNTNVRIAVNASKTVNWKPMLRSRTCGCRKQH